MSATATARRLRRDQTDEEKELWRALRAGRFAGFKFRRQHPNGNFFLDFYCPAARLSVELDGSQHGLPERNQRFVPPKPEQLAERPANAAVCRPRA
jgi:very-short-patch-repair endonuclease